MVGLGIFKRPLFSIETKKNEESRDELKRDFLSIDVSNHPNRF